MKTVHLLVSDLFLPEDIATEACAGLHLPALERILARGSTRTDVAETSLEALLCVAFGLQGTVELPIAPVAAAFDGLGEGCWLRADPVHLELQGSQLVLFPEPEISAEEAACFCASLNEHFAGQGMVIYAPHPQRWYVRLDKPANIQTVPLSLAAGRGIVELLPSGTEATRWRQVFNEAQMLLFAHLLNAERETRGMATVNSVWLWGCGDFTAPSTPPYGSAASDDALAEMLAVATGVPFTGWPQRWDAGTAENRQLLVFNGLRVALRRGDLAGWRMALQEFETGYAQPLWQALRDGKIAGLQMDIMGDDSSRRMSLTRADTWAFWRRGRRLAV